MTAVPITRRAFVGGLAGLAATLLVPACARKAAVAPDAVLTLNQLKGNEIIGEIRTGGITLMHKQLENLSPKGGEALALVQDALVNLDLLQLNPEERGIYGDKTARAVHYLQTWSGIDRMQGKDGRLFGKKTLAALENALEAKIQGNWKVILLEKPIAATNY